MKNFLSFTVLLIFFSVPGIAQPILSDDCASIYNLGEAPACPDTMFFTNFNATESMVFSDPGDNLPSCWSHTDRDVWIQVDIPSDGSLVDFTITVTGMDDNMGNTGMTQPQLAIYRGECGEDELAELDCAVADPGESFVELDVPGLTPGLPIFLRINDWSDGSPNWGTFQVCVDTLRPVILISEGGSTDCTGQLADSGGPDGNYGSDENHVFTICPSQPHNCIIFTLDYFNIENLVDEIIFFDSDTNDPTAEILSIDGFSDFPIPLTFGGVCLEVQASSGCLTIQFTSDGSLEFEGFLGSWECTTSACEPKEIVDVDPEADNQTIEEALTSAATVVTVDTIICSDGAYGTFISPDNSDLGLGKGLVLTSGSAGVIGGPNNAGGTGTSLGLPGDPDLDTLSNIFGDNVISFDACIVEVDVFVATNEITFEYIFGSEEYPEFVNDIFNDIFALLVSGPGITGIPQINNQQNVAVLPDGMNTPVQIKSVNHELNWQYYRNNEFGQSVIYDGLTSDFLGEKKSLTARVEVEPCNTYHLKFAVADRGDGVFDSGVFISEIRGGTPGLALQSETGLDHLIEGCTGEKDSIVLQLSNVLDDTISYEVVIGGTAVAGVDYESTLSNGTIITFLPGENRVSFPITPITDTIAEGIDTIEYSLLSDFGCGLVEVEKLFIEIFDQPDIEINSGEDTTIVCEGFSTQLSVDGAIDYFWTPVSVFDDETIPNPTATPDSSQWVHVIGSFPDAPPGCDDRDSIFLKIVDPQIEIVPISDTALCTGDTLILEAVNNLGDANLIWQPTFNVLSDPNDPVLVALPTFFTTYTASVSLEGCDAFDQQTVTVDFFEFPDVIDDTLICQGDDIKLADDIFLPSTFYIWTPTEFLDNPFVPGPVASPTETTTFKVIAVSASFACTDSAEITVEVTPSDVDIVPDEVAFICTGDTVELSATTTTGEITWSPDNGTLSSQNELNVKAFPNQSTWYFGTITIGNCTATDSILVSVDSFPASMAISPFPDKDTFCLGDTITLLSPNFDPNLYPDIKHNWSEDLNIITPLNNYNIIVVASESSVLQRVSTNNACIDTVEFPLTVIDPVLEASLTDTTLCQGGSFQVVVSGADDNSVFWTPGQGLSCNDCPDPTVTPEEDIAYIFSGEVQGCPTQDSIFVNVDRLPEDLEISPSPDKEIFCFGDTVVLSSPDFDPGLFPEIQHQWSPGMDIISPLDNFNATLVATDTTLLQRVTTNNTCSDTSEFLLIVVNPSLMTSVTDTSICEGESFQVTVSGADGNSVSWMPAEGLSCDDCPNPTVSPADDETYTFMGEVNGCPTEGTVSVTVLDPIFVEIFADPDIEIDQGADIMLDVQTDPDVSFTGTFTWMKNGQPFEGTGPTVTDIKVLEEQVIYKVTVEDEEFCPGMAEITINTIEPEYGIPNAFTPNGDGLNDDFRVIYTGLLEVTRFQVFNRWGKMIFETKDINEGWDGRQDGKDAPADVYIYMIEVLKPDSEVPVPESGDVTLIR